MTLKIFAALGTTAVLMTAPVFSAPHHGKGPPPPNALQHRSPPPAGPPPHPFGAAAARRAQALGRQNFARSPSPYHPPGPAQRPAPAQMRFHGAFGYAPTVGRQPAGPKSPAQPSYWAHGGSAGRTPHGPGAFGRPLNSNRRRPPPPNQSPGHPVGNQFRQTPGQHSNQWRQQHNFFNQNAPGGNVGSRLQYGHPNQYRGYGHPGRYQGYPQRRFNHRNANHFWERAWEHNYHAYNRYHWRPYLRPHGWYAHQWRFGMYLPYLFWTRNYWITNYWNFGLSQPPYGYIWVREGNNALLINEQDGYILQVIYNIFY